jgi:hypothetical protein
MRFMPLGKIQVAVFFMMLGLATSAAAQGVGGISGTVTDSSGGVMPGATVTLTNVQGAVGGNQTTVTSELGTYQFLRLVPGTYLVKAELQGFRPAEARDIIVNSDLNARADLRLEVGALAEGVTVTGQAPLLDTSVALRQTVITRAQLEELPNRTDVWSVAKVIPGVILSKVDVGGSEGFLQSSMTVRGSTSGNKFTIDGMDVSSLDGNASIATMYLDPASFQESNFMMGQGSAENGNAGLTINMVTRTGTNQLHGGGGMPGGTWGRMARARNFTDKQKADLLSSVPALALAANPNINPSADIDHSTDLSLWLAGPAVKDKLWYSVSWHDQRFLQYKLGSYNPDGTQVPDDNILWNTTAKVSYQLTKSAQVSYFNNLQYKLIGHRGGATFGDEHARQYNFKYPDVNQAKFTSPFGTKVVMDITFNRFRADDCFCKEPEVKAGTISKTDTVRLTQTDALPTYNDNMMFRDQVKASGSFFFKRHDLRFGAEWLKGGEKSRTWTTNVMQARYSSGLPNSVIAMALPETKSSDPGGPDIPIQFERWSRDVNTYLQDRYTVARRLVLNLGLRYEMNRSWMPPACRPGSTFLPVSAMPNGGCYPEVDYAPKFNGLAARFNAVYDLSGDGKTAIKFSANQYNESINISVVSALNSVGTLTNTRPWGVCTAGQTISCDVNGDLIPQLNELADLAYNIPAVTRNPYEGKIKWPKSYEYSGEVQRQLPGQMVASVSFVRTLTRDQLGTRNTNVPTSAYTAVNVTEKVTGKAVTVYFKDPIYNGVATNNVQFTTPLLNQEYSGVDLTLNKRMSNRWSFTGGASFGRTVNHNGGGDQNNPTNRAFDGGVTANSRPWSYRLSGVYQAPYHWIASGTFVFDKGAGETTSVVVGTDTIAFPVGNGTTQTVTVAKREETCCGVSAADGWTPYRNNLVQLDMSLRRTFRFQGKTFVPRLDLFNALNNSTVTAQVTQLGPTYHRVSGIQAGRMIKVGFNYEF